jgi:hypothetical protein
VRIPRDSSTIVLARCRPLPHSCCVLSLCVCVCVLTLSLSQSLHARSLSHTLSLSYCPPPPPPHPPPFFPLKPPPSRARTDPRTFGAPGRGVHSKASSTVLCVCVCVRVRERERERERERAGIISSAVFRRCVVQKKYHVSEQPSPLWPFASSHSSLMLVTDSL